MRSADVDDDGDDCLGVVDFPAGPPRRGRCELSNFYFTACGGQRIALPKHALYRVGTPLRRWHRPTPCDCARGALCSRGWPPIAWEHVTVVVALDNCGQRAAGWFVQFRGAGASPLELVRLPTGVAAQLLDELPLESDAWQHPDVATQKPWADFEALAVARYRSLVPPGRAVAQRTRSQPPSPPPPVPSRDGKSCASPRAQGPTRRRLRRLLRGGHPSCRAAVARPPRCAHGATLRHAACASSASAVGWRASTCARAAAPTTCRSTSTATRAPCARGAPSVWIALTRTPRAPRAIRCGRRRCWTHFQKAVSKIDTPPCAAFCASPTNPPPCQCRRRRRT